MISSSVATMQWFESDEYQNIVSDKKKSEQYPEAWRGDPVCNSCCCFHTILNLQALQQSIIVQFNAAICKSRSLTSK